MPFFDTDAHVYENEVGFADKYLDPKYREQRPRVVAVDNRPHGHVEAELLPRGFGRAPAMLRAPLAYGESDMAAAAEDLTVVVHVGTSWPALHNLYDNHFFSMSLAFTLPVLLGFAAITGGGVLDKVPSLRVGFLEAGCLWVHFLSERLEHRYDLGYRMADVIGTPPPPAQRHPLEYLR